MSITSINFIILFIIIVAIHYLIPGKMRNGWLLLVSYIFIGLWNWQSAVVLLCVTIFQYVYGAWLSKNQRPYLLVLGIGVNLALLLFFRSANFFVPELIALLTRLGFRSTTGGLEFLIPIGLSYIVLQNISYLVDVYRKQMLPASNFINYALYLAYFPKLLAGPIERARTFLPKLENGSLGISVIGPRFGGVSVRSNAHTPKSGVSPQEFPETLKNDRVIGEQNVAGSITLILGGMVRKLVIADSLSAAIPTSVFETPAFYSAYDLIGWLLVYAFVIYNDFAGYTSVARGLSGLLGIQLSKNFDYPYFARNFSEFWNRWHITLSYWLRDYIYFPLSRALIRVLPNRQNIVNLFAPPMITMLVSGLWHGLSWHMVFWGALHGIYQFAERIIMVGKPVIPPERQPRWRQRLSNATVFILVILAWVPFRMNLTTALNYWRGMLNLTNFSLNSKILLVALVFLGFVAFLEWILYRYQDQIGGYRLPQWVQAGIMAAALYIILIASSSGTQTPFIYQGF
jgi:alginate O-acetyltransferase complex protein AlgI